MQKPIIERAFELAKSRQFGDVQAIERALSKEGYANTYTELSGRELRRVLNGFCKGEVTAVRKRRTRTATRAYPF